MIVDPLEHPGEPAIRKRIHTQYAPAWIGFVHFTGIAYHWARTIV